MRCNLLGCDAVQFVILHLFGAPAVGFAYCFFHRRGYLVGIHDYQTVHVPGSAACGLGECAGRAQEPFLVGIQDGYERHAGKVESFAQQVHTNQHVEKAVLEVFDYLHPFGGIDVGMDIADPHSNPAEVLVEFFCHALGEGGYQYALVGFCPLLDLLHQVVHLMLYGSNLYWRIQQPCRTYHLLCNQAS